MSETPERTSIFERNPRKSILSVLIVLFFIIDIVVAYGARLILGHPYHNRPSEHHYLQENPNKNYRTESDIYHHDLKRNIFSDSAMWGDYYYSVYTDSLGFKSDRIKTTPLETDRRRILFIGDSFTEGLGFGYAKTFVGRIAAALAEQGVEVLNAGVSSYSPIIYWRKVKYLLEDVGLEFQDLVVYLDISDIEDEAIFYQLTAEGTVERLKSFNNTQRDNTEQAGWSIKRILRDGTVFTYFLLNETHDALYGRSDKIESSIGLPRARWTIDETLFNAYGREGLARATEYMTRLYKLLSMHGIRLTIAVYPWPDQIISGDLDSIQVSHWKEWADIRGVDFLNYFPCFVNEDGSDSVLEKYYFLGDVHWNERGHEFIAENFLQWFKDPATESEECCCE